MAHLLHLSSLEVLQAMGLLLSAISFELLHTNWTELLDGHGTPLKLCFCQFLSTAWYHHIFQTTISSECILCSYIQVVLEPFHTTIALS